MDTMSDIAMGFAMEHVMVKFRGRRNTSSILQSNFVAGAALGERYGQILWQAQHFKHLAVKFRGRCSTWSTL